MTFVVHEQMAGYSYEVLLGKSIVRTLALRKMLIESNGAVALIGPRYVGTNCVAQCAWSVLTFVDI